MKTNETHIGAANELQTSASDWLLLVEYGEHPHEKGLQKITQEIAQKLASDFQSLRSRLARKFVGCPVYVGHPDDPDFNCRPGHSDTRAYAWVDAMQARDDGLYILPRWSKAGSEMLSSSYYRFLSPRWLMKRTGKTFEPVRLVSVGMTNQPNIAGQAIANERIQKTDTIITAANMSTALHTSSSLCGLAQRNQLAASQRPFLEQVHERMRLSGEDFETAWKQTRTHTPLS